MLCLQDKWYTYGRYGSQLRLTATVSGILHMLRMLCSTSAIQLRQLVPAWHCQQCIHPGSPRPLQDSDL